MAATVSMTPLVFEFIGIVFTAILYGKCTIQHLIKMSERSVIGFYCVIFGLYWRIQLKNADRRRNGILPYALIAIFILCTAYFINSTVQFKIYINVSHIKVVYYCLVTPNMNGVQLIFEISTRNPLEAALNEEFAVYRMTNANDALYIASTSFRN
jgi:hypothetical protein